MILTCPKCQAQYKLDPAVLGVAGREVRCVSCSHAWFQIPDTAVPEAAAAPAAEAAPEAPLETETQPAQSVTDALSEILEKDGAAFDAVLSTVAQNEQQKKGAAAGRKSATAAESAPAEALPREPAEKQTLPQETVLPIVTHDPLGMNANVFGGAVFLFCCFFTLSVVLIGKGGIVRHWPSTRLFYRTLGFDMQPPGAGLKFSGLTAKRRIEDSGKTLVLEGKMTNMTDHDIAYPPLRVILKGDDGVVTKSWDVKTGVSRISGGDVVPVMMQLGDAPEEGSTVELRVKGKNDGR